MAIINDTIIDASIDTSDATATAEDILSGKTAWVNGSKVTGTLVQKEVVTGTLKASSGNLQSLTIPNMSNYANAYIVLESLVTTGGNAVTFGNNSIISVVKLNGSFFRADTVSSTPSFFCRNNLVSISGNTINASNLSFVSPNLTNLCYRYIMWN